MHDHRNPPKGNPIISDRSPPDAPREEAAALKDNYKSGSYLGTTKRLPEFNLNDKVVLVTGAARGLGLVQAEALLEAGATVYALDRLPEPSADFYRVQQRAAEELGRSCSLWGHLVILAYTSGAGNTLHYRQIDVRDVQGLNTVVKSISDAQGRLDGLIAAAGIQQETSALDYTQADANMMFEVNVTGEWAWLIVAQKITTEVY
jgi:NAD(P)-dependent dehydrogenase (short-subunit alcohol dehydrogenase family)